MMKKLSWLVAFVVVSLSAAQSQAWYVRSTANQWTTSEMKSVGNNMFESCQSFGNGDANGPARFKITRYADWSVHYPPQDKVVAANQAHKIIFNASTFEVATQPVADCTKPKKEASLTLSFAPTLYGQAPTVWAWISGASSISEIEGYSWNSQQIMQVDATTGYYQWQMDKKYQTELDSGLLLNIIVNKTDEFSRQTSGCYTGKRWNDELSQCTQ